MGEMEYNQVRAPRLCLMMREEIGYGFNLHGEKGVVGQYISAVDLGGSADKSGLCVGDRVIEVNGVNVENAKHSEVVERIRSDREKTTLLVIDQVTDKYLTSIGKPVTADLAKLKSVTERYPPVRDSPKNNVNESELVSKLGELKCDEKTDHSVNDESVRADDTENITEIREEKTPYIKHETVGDKIYEPSRVVEDNVRSVSEEQVSSVPRNVPDGGVSDKPADTEYYNDGAVNITSGVEYGERRSSTPRPVTPGNGSLGGYEKVRPSTVPRRKEVKQGDWRAKLALFDQL